MMTKDITKENFEQEVLQSDQPVLLEFWANWCGQCKAFAPVIDEVCKDMGDKVKICKVEVDENPELAAEYEVRAIPTMFIIKDGEVIDTIEGARTKEELEQKLDSL